MVARLRSARIASRDLISGFPKALGSLESDLATIFGFTMDSDITVTPLGLDNSGGVTKDLVFQKCPTETSAAGDSAGYGIGLSIENSSNTDNLYLTQETFSGGQKFNVRPASLGITSFPIFGIDMTNGKLTGYTTQDLASTPLIPATGGASASNYYNAGGHFSVPGVSPSFDGVGLWASSTTAVAGATTSQKWTTTSPSGAQAGFDVSGHFNEVADATKITLTTSGKYVFVVHLAVYCPSDDPQDVTMTLQLNGSTTLYSQTYQVKSNFAYCTITTTADITATDYVKLRVGSGIADDFTSGFDPGIVAAFPQNFAGRFYCYRVE